MALERQKENLKGAASMLGGLLKEVMTGKIVYRDFLKRQAFVIVMIVVFLICYIGLRFTCEDQIRQIDRLQTKLKDVKMEALSRSSELLGMGKQSQIKKMVALQDSFLFSSEIPPFIISK
ncbi:MAG: hypothetical protein MJZ14_06060 [Paludibacteraceae bacterium]|nr:hypothetical protein [Paludibacteraceae bacterium]